MLCSFATFLLLFAFVDANIDPQVKVQQAIAINKCRSKLKEDPTFPRAQYALGILLEATGEAEEVADLSWEAGNNDDRPLEASQRVDALMRAGKSFLQLGNTCRATASYHRALKLVEDAAMAEEILHQVTPLLLRDHAMEMTPNLPNLAINLTRRFPHSPIVVQFHGAVSRKSGDLEAAFQSYHRATTLGTPSAATVILAAASAREAGRSLAEQMEYLQQGLQRTGDDELDDRAELLNNLGIACKKAGEKEKAINFFQLALSNKPGDGHALAQLASLGAPQQAKTFDLDYVQGLFDTFSSTFEQKLLSLDYQGHEWVAQELMLRLKAIKTPTIIDLGCGTGLVGNALVRSLSPRPHVVGVDISKRMVEICRTRTLQGQQIYNDVKQADAEAFLKGLEKESVDAVVAADVFIYIGELENIFSAIWGTLSRSGLLIFSVELSEGGVTLMKSGRFGHCEKYIKEIAKRTGFDFISWKEGTLRKQHGAPVQGAVVVLQK